jgi:hypothetical protein
MFIAVLVRRLREGKRAIYEQLDEFDFSTNETVERGRRP